MVAAGVCCAIAMLVWLSYVSTREWQRQTNVLLEQREAEALALTSTALGRDMRGAWTSVIAPLNVIELGDEAQYDVMQIAARAFARFPYPESFILWKNDVTGPSTFAFNRTERMPPWDKVPFDDEPFPVSLTRDPPALNTAIDLVLESKPLTRFVSVETTIEGVPYHIVAHRMFSATPPHALNAFVAFTVNLDWVRREYFGPLLRQVAQIGGNQQTLSLSVVDSDGREVATSGAASGPGLDLRRSFPMLFLDAAVAAPSMRGQIPAQDWYVHVKPSVNNPLLAAQQSTRLMFFLMALAATISTGALLMTVRAVRASAALASMKSDFVAAVTHDLKTPVAAIRLVGDTLARRRYDSVETVADYARLLSQEAARLSRSIDGLLTYSRYTEWSRTPVSSSAFDIADVIEDALEELRPLLDQLGFDLTVDVPRSLSPVSADRPALVQVVECVIDNAIKYSADAPALRIVGRMDAGRVRVSFSDKGIGIPPEDIRHVFDRFYRGHNVSKAGSGLGLTIAQRIVNAHGGTIDIRSTINVGTDVELSLLPAKVA
jgi:signal transduction histidine kinase